MKKNYDKDAWLKEQEEKLRDYKNKVLEIAKSFQTNPEEIAELLAFKTKFYRYSLRNTMMIYSYNPYATFTASYQGFKKMGWSVQKNAQKLPILVPVKITYLIHDGKWIPLSVADEALKKAYRAGEIESEVIQRYKIGYVYDISQTNCPPEQYPKFYNMGAASMDHKLACDAMKEYAETRLHCSVSIKNLSSISLRGFYLRGENKLILSDKLNDTQRLSTGLHELSHAILHHSPDALQKNTAQKEFEADALSVMLQYHAGLELTDVRKQHLANHYHDLVNNLPKNLTIEKILDHVSETYRNMIEDFDAVMNKYLEQRQEKPEEKEVLQGTKDFKILNFSVKDHVYMANVQYGNRQETRAVMEQSGILHIQTGSKLTGDLERHNFKPYDIERYYAFEYAHRAYALAWALGGSVLHGTYDSMTFHRDGADPLTIEKQGDVLTISHVFHNENQTFYSPKITFRINAAEQTLTPLSYEHTDRNTSYSTKDDPKLQMELNKYCVEKWFPDFKKGFRPKYAIQNGQKLIFQKDGTTRLEESEPQQGPKLKMGG